MANIFGRNGGYARSLNNRVYEISKAREAESLDRPFNPLPETLPDSRDYGPPPPPTASQLDGISRELASLKSKNDAFELEIASLKSQLVDVKHDLSKVPEVVGL